ncbi:MAG: hydrogenase expression/formation protein HypE [Actinomycetota bacterium]|nr:hydrogenase expression/formation protein HypE [Actinomycetota bacterium]
MKPSNDEPLVMMAHGGGGRKMQQLLEEVVFPILSDESLNEGEDAAVMRDFVGNLALTTDSFVIQPLVFPGGDIGKLAVCGTINDLAMRGAKPLYLTMGLIIEEGFRLNLLKDILTSASECARDANVRIVTGDTKVVERGNADGLYINTAGVGIVPEGCEVSISGAMSGDVIVVNGYVGDHGIAVLGGRDEQSFEMNVLSDCAPLHNLVSEMLEVGGVHALRDPTRGGIAAALNEMAQASNVQFDVFESSMPVREEVRAVCEMLGLDPFYVANEGKLVASISQGKADEVLEVMRGNDLGKDSRIVGRVLNGRRGLVNLLTSVGSKRILRMPSGEQLPRIC